MIAAGIKTGLTETAEHVQPLSGCKAPETGPPDKLREMVTSPGGTPAGLKVFEEKGFKEIISGVIEAAAKRSKELGRRE
jgi:pyrroline-5-carboxylate reductase